MSHISGQYDKARKHIVAQWNKLHTKKQRRQLKQLLREQEKDAKHEQYLHPEIIQPEKDYSHLKPRERAIVVLNKTGLFTHDEIAAVVGLARSTITDTISRNEARLP